MKTLPLCGAMVALAGLAPFASAGVLTYTDLGEGLSSQVVDFGGVPTTVTTAYGATKLKTVNGVTGMGISGGTVDGEIDNCESMTFSFDSNVSVDELTISFLYNDHEFGDHPAEVARIVTDDFVGTLTVTGPTTAVWTGGGTVTNVSVATEAGGGAWTLSGDLFGDDISFLRLESGNPGHKGKYADFSFVSMSGVPTPGTAALLGLGGALCVRRRRA